MVDGDAIVFVEWCERALAALPELYCVVGFEFPAETTPETQPVSDDDRILAISWHGQGAPERARDVATTLAQLLHPEAG